MVARSRAFEFLTRRSFTRGEGLAAGATNSRLRAKSLCTPSRGIRVPIGKLQTLLDRVRPYTVLNQRCCISHVTAAQLHGLPLPWFDEDIRAIHLTNPAREAQPRRRGVVGHTTNLNRSEIVYMDGVPVTTPARTFLDLATILTLDQLVAVADFLICEHDRPFEPPKMAIVQAATLRSYVDGKHHLRGLAKVRAATDLMRSGVDSPPETQLRLILQRAGLPVFLTNYAIPGDPEVWPDLACEEFKTCSEYEGEIHKTTQKQLFDRNRDERTAQRGWLQVKIYQADMRRGNAHVAEMVKKALRRQGWNG